MNGRKHIAVIVGLFLFAFGGWGQDAFQSQYWTQPSLVNPAQTGLIETDYRASTAYRSQWASVHSPFKTASAAFDTRLKTGGSFIGVGGYVRDDRIETANYSVFEVGGQSAYHLQVGRKNYLSFGLSVGYRRHSINFDGLAWDSQYNGVGYDPGIDSGESFTGAAKGVVDAAFGANYRHIGRSRYDVGYAAWHYFQNQGLLTGGNDRLIVRQQVIFAWYQSLGDLEMVYDFLGGVQGGAQMLTAGARAFYQIGSDSRYTTASTSNSVVGGLHYRWADAVVVSAGFRYKRALTFTAGYDITTSSLTSTNQSRGAWEIALIWEGRYASNRLKLR